MAGRVREGAATEFWKGVGGTILGGIVLLLVGQWIAGPQPAAPGGGSTGQAALPAESAKPAPLKSTATPAIVGHWIGPVEETDSPIRDYQATVDVGINDLGRLTGTVHYSSFECRGTWLSALGEAVTTHGPWQVREEITNQGRITCGSGHSVYLTLRSDGRLDYVADDARAILTKTQR